MANEIGNLDIKIQAQADLAKALQQINAAFNTIQTEAAKTGRKINTNLSTTLGQSGWVGNNVENATIAGKAYKNQLKPAVEKASQAINKLNPILVKSGTNTKQLASNLGGFRVMAKQATKAVDPLAKNLWLLSAGLQKMSAVLIPISAAMVGFGTIAVKSFADLEKATDDLQASLGTTEEIAQTLQKQFQGLSTEIPASTEEFLTMAKSAAEAGVASKNILTFTKSMAQLQTITNELDVENVSEALVNISKAFNLSLGNIDKTISVLRATAKASSVTMDDFVGSLRRASPSAKTLGVSLEQTSAILGTLIPIQESAERTGTRLNQVFNRMATRLPKLAAQMGITENQLKTMIDQDATNVLLNYIDRLEQTSSAVEQLQGATEVFGEQGAKAIVALIGKTDEIRASIKDLNEEFRTGKTFQEDYAISIDNLASQFKILKNTSTVTLQAIGAEIAPLVSKFISKLTNSIRILVAMWLSLSEPVKKTIVYIGLLITSIIVTLTAFTALLLALTTLSSGFATAYRSVMALIAALGKSLIPALAKSGIAVKTFGLIAKASFWKITLIITAIVSAIYILGQALKALNVKLPDFGSMIKKAFKLDNLSSGFSQIDDALQDLDDKANETTNSIKKAFGSLNALGLKWGNEFINNYINAFSTADLKILDDVSSIVEQYYKIQEKAGKQSAEQAILNTEKTRGIVARAINDIKELGTVSSDVLSGLQSNIGVARTKSIIDEIKSALKVEEINDAIELIKDSIDDRKKALEDETDLIEKEIETVKDSYEPRIEAQEDIIKDLEDQKDYLQKLYKTETKIYETQVNTAKDNLDAAEEALDDLKDLRGEEVDIAEGMVEYAKMNLDAAQNALKRETILGKNEYDATYRAAIARVESAEQAVELAQDSYLKIKKSADKEIKVNENEIKILEKKYDTTKDSLDAYKESYEDELDIIQEKLDAAKDNLSDIKDAQEEALDILSDEKDLLKEKYDTEINILEERENILQKSLKAEQEVYSKIKAIRDEYLRNVNAQLSAIKDASDILPEAGVGINQNTTTNKNVPKVTDLTSKSPIESIMDSIQKNILTPISLKIPSNETIKQDIFKLLFGESKEDMEKEMQTTGKSFAEVLMTSIWDQIKLLHDRLFSNILGLIFGTDKLEEAKTEAKENGKSISTNLIDGLKEDLNSKINLIREAINNNIIAPIVEKFDLISKVGIALGKYLILGWETGLSTLSNVGSWIYNNIIKPVGQYFENLYNNSVSWGKNLLIGFMQGVVSKFYNTLDIFNVIYNSIANFFRNLSKNTLTWGKNLIINFANGIRNGITAVKEAVGWLGNAISNMLKSQSPPKEGPLSTIDKWGVGLMKTYASSLKDGLPYIENSISDISKAIKDPLEAMDGVNITSDLNKNINAPIAPTPITNVTQQGSKTIQINPGMMVASEGEIRSFVRMLEPYLKTENQRIIGGQNG